MSRTEGDLTIVPVLEEVIVVETKLLLEEEIHIRRTLTKETVERSVTQEAGRHPRPRRRDRITGE
jgi:hypothetical protein